MALLVKAAEQGHAYAMEGLARIHDVRMEPERAVEWYTKAAEAGLPDAMFALASFLENGHGMAAPNYPAAVHWYTLAADAGDGHAANNLANMYDLGCGRDW